MKYLHHSILCIKSDTPTRSDYVLLLVSSCCLTDNAYTLLLPGLMFVLVLLYISSCTASNLSNHRSITPSSFMRSINGKSFVASRCCIVITSFMWSSSSNFSPICNDNLSRSKGHVFLFLIDIDTVQLWYDMLLYHLKIVVDIWFY